MFYQSNTLKTKMLSRNVEVLVLGGVSEWSLSKNWNVYKAHHTRTKCWSRCIIEIEWRSHNYFLKKLSNLWVKSYRCNTVNLVSGHKERPGAASPRTRRRHLIMLTIVGSLSVIYIKKVSSRSGDLLEDSSK